MRLAKVLTSLRICTVSPEPSLIASTKLGLGQNLGPGPTRKLLMKVYLKYGFTLNYSPPSVVCWLGPSMKELLIFFFGHHKIELFLDLCYTDFRGEGGSG